MDLSLTTQQQAMVDRANQVKVMADQMSVQTDEEQQKAVEFLGTVASLKKAMEAERTNLVKPLNDQVKEINDAYRKFQEPVLVADKTARGKVSQYVVFKQQLAAEAQRKALEEAAKQTAATGEVVPAVIPEAPPTVVRTETGTAYTRLVWDFKIDDETQVPVQYKVVDERRIRAAVASGLRFITGVTIFQRAELTVTGKR